MRTAITIIVSIAIGFILSIALSRLTLTEEQKEINSLAQECMQYNDSKDECVTTSISTVAEEIKNENN